MLASRQREVIQTISAARTGSIVLNWPNPLLLPDHRYLNVPWDRAGRQSPRHTKHEGEGGRDGDRCDGTLPDRRFDLLHEAADF
jgi:hypothetical protein